MKVKTVIAMGLLMVCSSLPAARMHGPSQRGEALMPEGPKIRLLLAKGVPSALLEAKGSYCVIRKETGAMISNGSVGKRYVVHAIEEGLRWGEEYPGISHFIVVPTNKQTVFYVDGFQYKGAIAVYQDQNRHITLVNELTIEDYLRSTLALKFDHQMSDEAMAAITIGARTEAYAQALAGRSAGAAWDLKAKEVGYYGNGVAFQTNGVEQSVENTRFMVVESAPGQPLQQVRLLRSKVEELANAGQDAKRILQSYFPHSHLGVTTDPSVR